MQWKMLNEQISELMLYEKDEMKRAIGVVKYNKQQNKKLEKRKPN